MPELREVFEMTTKQVEPDVDAWREQEGRQRRSTRNTKIGAFAVAAAIGLAAVALIIGTWVGQNATTPVNQPTTVAPVDAMAVEVATGFVEALGAFDADRAITYLADDSALSGIGLEGTRELRMLLSMNEAMGYKQILTSCEETGRSFSSTYVRCDYDFHALGSDEIGLGPYSGSYFNLTVVDGEIARVAEYFEIGESTGFSRQMWEPFATWVSTNYPKDAAVMYNATLTDYRLTEESIRLWERHTRGYVQEVGPG
jgi:hypothetical protein